MVTTRSPAAIVKRHWRAAQRRWGEDKRLYDITEHQMFSLVRILVLLLNIRDKATGSRATHARALGARLEWSQGVLIPRLQRLESLGYVISQPEVRVIGGKQVRVLSYVVTGKGEAAAVTLAPHFVKMLTIAPHERRRV